MQRLWAFLAKQQWVADTSGCSLAELYVFFLRETGLYVPINISSFEQSTRPASFRKQTASTVVWVHELEWPALALSRQGFPYGLELFGIFLKVFLADGCSLGDIPDAFSEISGLPEDSCFRFLQTQGHL